MGLEVVVLGVQGEADNARPPAGTSIGALSTLRNVGGPSYSTGSVSSGVSPGPVGRSGGSTRGWSV